MFNQIVYLPKFGNDLQSKTEAYAIKGIIAAGKELQIPTCTWNVYWERTPSNILYVALGGDGTMLTAMREAVKHEGSTVIGINFGKLGFLTSIDDTGIFAGHCDRIENDSTYDRTNPYEQLIHDLHNSHSTWQLTQRMAIGASFDTGLGHTKDSVAINEFLVTTPTRRNPLQYEIFINGEFVASQQGDGVIIATASGSTAYALSAGGAIMTPSSTAIQIVPLAAHTLTAKPIVVSGRDEISIHANLNQRANKIVVFNDGCEAFSISNEDNDKFQLTINKREMVNVWYPRGRNFFNVLTEKMGW